MKPLWTLNAIVLGLAAAGALLNALLVSDTAWEGLAWGAACLNAAAGTMAALGARNLAHA